jgi:hypothetical protein
MNNISIVSPHRRTPRAAARRARVRGLAADPETAGAAFSFDASII